MFLKPGLIVFRVFRKHKNNYSHQKQKIDFKFSYDLTNLSKFSTGKDNLYKNNIVEYDKSNSAFNYHVFITLLMNKFWVKL